MLGAMLAAMRRANDRAGSERQWHNLHLRRAGHDVEHVDLGDLPPVTVARTARTGDQGSGRSSRPPRTRCRDADPDPRSRGRGVAALPADYRHHAHGVTTDRARRACDRARHDGDHLDRLLWRDPDCSIRPVSSPVRPGLSSDTLIFLSAWGRACASAQRSRCTRRPSCWRCSCATSPSTWRPASQCGRSSISLCGRATAYA